MSRTFAYIRVSKYSQDTDNQIGEIETAGFSVEPHRIIREIISGSVPTNKRKGFSLLEGVREAKNML